MNVAAFEISSELIRKAEEDMIKRTGLVLHWIWRIPGRPHPSNFPASQHLLERDWSQIQCKEHKCSAENVGDERSYGIGESLSVWNIYPLL